MLTEHFPVMFEDGFEFKALFMLIFLGQRRILIPNMGLHKLIDKKWTLIKL